MIIKDINGAPYFFDDDAIIMICVAAVESTEGEEEKPYSERSAPIKVVSFVLHFGIRQDVIMSHNTFVQLWDRLEASHE
jgi:hypothetical protein